MLQCYRGLDLTNELGVICGRILGDLGIDIIKVEPPEGDSARQIGPYYGDEADANKSLFWMAYNANKRGITLNLNSKEGQGLLARLVEKCDLIIESFPPGYLANIGLDYATLSKINPKLVMTSITPYGQTGPYSKFKASDLTLLAMGGQMYISGDADRQPVRVCAPPQAYLLASAHAAVGTLLALWHRHQTGIGQHVDVSAQGAVTRLWGFDLLSWPYEHKLIRRSGPRYPRGGKLFRYIWPCEDGHVTFLLFGGKYTALVTPLIHWMAELDLAESLAANWQDLDFDKLSQVDIDRIEGVIGRFFMHFTKAELWEEARKRRIAVAPICNLKEVSQDPHLKSRDYWVKVEYQELGITLDYPGFPYRFSAAPCHIRHQAPRTGEHNQEIYADIGVSPNEMTELKRRGVI